MPQPPNKALRIGVPLIFLAVGIGLFIATVNSTPPSKASPATPNGTSSSTPNGEIAKPEAPQAVDEAAAGAPASGTAEPAGGQPVSGDEAAPRAIALQARVVSDSTGALPSPIGSLDPATGFKMEIRFNPVGAGIDRLTLTDHFETIERTKQDTLQRAMVNKDGYGVIPFAADTLTINGVSVRLSGGSVWKEIAPGSFEAFVDDEAGAPVARVVRTYVLSPASYEVKLKQTVFNMTQGAVKAQWSQSGPVDVPPGPIRYGSDPRRLRFGYLLSPRSDPQRRYIISDKLIIPQATAVTHKTGALWPTEAAAKDSHALAWVASTSQYFAVALHGDVPTAAASQAPPSREFRGIQEVRRRVLPAPLDEAGNVIMVSKRVADVVTLHLTGAVLDVPAGGQADLSMGIYAGPISRKYIDVEPAAEAAGLSGLVLYNSGGPCAFCVFDWIALPMRATLGFLHDVLFRDWALAIMAFVVLVRLILHPISKYQQVNMMRFSKQMQALAPKQKRLQEQYASDPAKLREEMANLMRSEHVQYSSAAKGCITPILQMPIWFAMFAIIQYTFELRHTPAFYGVVQHLTGGRWHFLADLSEQDKLIPIGDVFEGWWILGNVTSINLLPLVLAVVFYIQQKYLTPPPSAPLTPEQQSQQTMMKWMTVILFPVFMYPAPSGLALYFLVNSTLGILESRYIRAHAEEKGLLDPKPKGDVKRRPGQRESFMDRLRRTVAEKQAEAMKLRQEQQRRQQKR